MSEFLNMGGYGGYVWPAYGIAALVLIALVWDSLRGLRASERELAEAEKTVPRRRAREGVR
jgi:heme exporter protein D